MIIIIIEKVTIRRGMEKKNVNVAVIKIEMKAILKKIITHPHTTRRLKTKKKLKKG